MFWGFLFPSVVGVRAVTVANGSEWTLISGLQMITDVLWTDHGAFFVLEPITHPLVGVPGAILVIAPGQSAVLVVARVFTPRNMVINRQPAIRS